MENEKRITEPFEDNSRKRSMLKIALFILVPIIALLILGEIFVRILGLGSPELDPTVYSNVPGDLTPRQDIVHRHPQTGVEYHIRINKYGFRGEGVPDDDRPGCVVCLGDSSMMGYGVDEGHTAPDYIRRWLDLDFPGVFSVINAASIGYTIDDELSYMKEKGASLDPDFVLLEIFYNDVTEKQWREQTGAGLQREFRRSGMTYTRGRSLLLRSALYQFFRSSMIKIMIRMGKFFPPNRTDAMDVVMHPSKHKQAWRDYDEALMEFIDFVRESGASPIVSITPHQYQVHEWGYPFGDYFGERDFQDHVLEVLEEKDVPAVDLMPPYLEAMKHIPSVYKTGGLYDEHTDAAGQYIKAREMYDALAESLKKKGYLNFYNELSDAEIRGAVRKGRLWIPENDAPCLAMEPGSSVLYRNVKTGEDPVLRFKPVYSSESGPELRLRISLVYENQQITIHEESLNPGQDKAGEMREVSLKDYPSSKMALKWELSAKGESKKDYEPELFVKSPLLIDRR